MFNFYIDKLTFLRKLRKDSYICELCVMLGRQCNIKTLVHGTNIDKLKIIIGIAENRLE